MYVLVNNVMGHCTPSGCFLSSNVTVCLQLEPEEIPLKYFGFSNKRYVVKFRGDGCEAGMIIKLVLYFYLKPMNAHGV